MKLLSRLMGRLKTRHMPFVVIRMSRRGHHYYSVLADSSGFEFVFRNEHNHWSTVSPTLARRILEGAQLKKAARSHRGLAEKFLRLATNNLVGSESSWEVSHEFRYPTRDIALQVERKILDKSWSDGDGDSDDR